MCNILSTTHLLFFMQLLYQATNKEGVVPSTSLLLASEMHSLDEIDPELFEYVSDVVDGLLVDVSIVVIGIVIA